VLGQVRLSSGTTAYTDTYLYTDAGAPYELLRTTGSGATSRYWYELDGRGNVVALTDSTGKVVDRYAYDSYRFSRDRDKRAKDYLFRQFWQDIPNETISVSRSGHTRLGARSARPSLGRSKRTT